jgi:hypothetical protein
MPFSLPPMADGTKLEGLLAIKRRFVFCLVPLVRPPHTISGLGPNGVRTDIAHHALLDAKWDVSSQNKK